MAQAGPPQEVPQVPRLLVRARNLICCINLGGVVDRGSEPAARLAKARKRFEQSPRGPGSRPCKEV